MRAEPQGRRGLTLRRAPVALLAALTLAVVSSLAACGVNEAAAAAVVDGRVISDEDVQTAAAETNRGVAELQTPFTARTTLPWLILAPFVLREAEREGKGVSAAQAQSALTRLDDPSPATIEFVRAYIAAQSSLSQEGVQRVLAQVARSKVTVNPRYGDFDPRQPAQLSTVTPPWVKPLPTTPATVPRLGGGQGQQGDGP